MDNSKILEITKDVSWIGILDEDIVTFDIVMETRFGTTYNSYFINAEKKTIIDTAKAGFKEDYLNKIKQVTDPSKIDYIILNHTEPDHSGCLGDLLELVPNAVVYGSRQAINYLNEMLGKLFNHEFVKDGDELDLGNKKLRFISAPNLHWPDTIYTYLEEEGLLFTCDSFGAHFCDEKMFDDEVDDYSEAFKYYFDVILRPFSKFMEKAIEKIENLPIRMICPGHGPVLRSTWKEKLDLTRGYTQQYLADAKCQDNAILITYVSAYGYTKLMAEKIAEGIKRVVDYKVNVIDIENILLGDLEELIVKSNAIIIGSPTINQNTLLPVYRMFSIINPIRDKGKKAASFGSYGWSGEAVGLIENQLKLLKLNVVQPGFSSRFYPHHDKETQLIGFGEEFAGHLVKK